MEWNEVKGTDVGHFLNKLKGQQMELTNVLFPGKLAASRA